jgi:arylsulfatase A-like enzyme
VGHVEIAPTVLDFLDEPIAADEEEAHSGASLRHLIDGDEEWPSQRHVIGHGDPLGVRTKRWKYIWWDRDGDKPVDSELFDLQTDPDETTDVSDEYPNVTSELDTCLSGHIAQAKETDHDPNTTTRNEGETSDEGIEAQLKALGYK